MAVGEYMIKQPAAFIVEETFACGKVDLGIHLNARG